MLSKISLRHTGLGWLSLGKGASSRERQMTKLSRITTDPQICGGRPCIRNMRIRVKDVLDLLAAGASHEEILEDYPYLDADDIKASLEYAAHQMDHPILNVA